MVAQSMTKIFKKPAIPQFLQYYAGDALFLLLATIGVVLLTGGLAIVILAATTSAASNDLILLQQSIAKTLSVIPGIPLNINDLNGYGLTATGLTTWIIGINLLAISLGLWRKNFFAKWAAILIFALASYFNFVQFILSGLAGAPLAIIGLVSNGLIFYMLWRLDYKKNLPVTSFTPTVEAPKILSIPEPALSLTGIQTQDSKQEPANITRKDNAPLVQTDNKKEVKPIEVVCVKNSVIEAAKEENKLQDDAGKTREIVSTSEIRLIIREVSPLEKENNQVTSRTQVIVRRTKEGVPVVIVETRNKRNIEVSTKEKQQEES